MLKISALLNETPFEFQDVTGEVVQLKATQFTVADVKSLVEIQRPILQDDEIPLEDKSLLLVVSRLVYSIKKADGTGDRMWNTPNDFIDAGYPSSLIDVLTEEVDKLNPKVTLDEKKS